MTFTFTDAKISVSDGVWICLKVNEPAQAREFILKKQARLYDCEVKRHREKRSLDANAYYWTLAGKLADAIRATPEEVYRRHIKDIGNYEVLCIQKEALDTFSRMWCSGHLGRFIDTRESKLQGCTTVLAYYGSSDFDTAQMSRLIDNCIQDCKAVGIETLTPDRLEAMKEAWGRA